MKIFQIGFNKAGTGSLHTFFLRNNIKSIHWDGGRLSRRMFSNIRDGKSVLSGLGEFDAYTDMEHFEENGVIRYVPMEILGSLVQEFPNSLYIFNTRNIDSWIFSRERHASGSYIKHVAEGMGLSYEKVKNKWREDYYRHEENVVNTLGGKSNFLYFNIDVSGGEELSDFLNCHGFRVSPEKWGHFHKTDKINAKVEPYDSPDVLRDIAIFYEKVDVQLSYKLMLRAKELRPHGATISEKVEEYRSRLRK